jgi:TrmH family RNA methyltransferase
LITSTQNPRIKNILKLDKARERREQNLFVIEGGREISLAIAGGYTFHSLYVCDELLSIEGRSLVKKLPVPAESISRTVFEKIAYRGQSDGIIAIAIPKQLQLSGIRLSEKPFIIVLEAVEKPGNLGAILRTADAARTDAVIVCDPQTDIYNPNTIRSSIGCVFTQQVITCTSEEALQWMKQSGIRVHAAELTASEWYHQADFTQPSAIVMGTEAEGLTGFWLDHADNRIKIPMRGRIDSLNVSVSTAIMTFEAMRQRDFK